MNRKICKYNNQNWCQHEKNIDLPIAKRCTGDCELKECLDNKLNNK